MDKFKGLEWNNKNASDITYVSEQEGVLISGLNMVLECNNCNNQFEIKANGTLFYGCKCGCQDYTIINKQKKTQ